MKTGTTLALVGLAALLGGCEALGLKEVKPATPTLGNRVAILGSEQGVEVDAATAAAPFALPAPVANPDWAQPGGNANKALGHVALGAELTPAWQATIPGSTDRVRLGAAPVVAGGRLYVADVNANVRAFDAATGAPAWSVALGGDDSDTRNALFGGGVSVAGNRVFATTGAGDVAALDAASGGLIWKVRPAGPLRGSPTLANGQVYVMTQDNQLYALNDADGAVVWQESVALEPGSVFGVAAPAAGQGTIVAGFSSGELNAYRYENGRNLWNDALARTSISVSVATLTDVDADPVIDRGRVYALGKGGRMAAYELVTGQRLWELNIAGVSTPWVSGDWVFVVTDDDRLLCVARATGKVRWISQLPSFLKPNSRSGPIRWSGPILAGNRLILASTTGTMIQVDPATGQLAAQAQVGRGYSLAPIVAGGMLYLLDDSGQISAYR